jgi:hypothetical protein
MDTGPEMHRLVSELSTDDFLGAHPVLQAAYAHYGLVQIHPFADGNGRVARALASVFLYRATSTPLLIFADLKPQYLEALRTADLGRPQAFVDFIAQRAIATMNLTSETVLDAAAPAAAETLGRLGRLNFAFGNVPWSTLDGRAAAIRENIQTALQAYVDELSVPTSSEVEPVEFSLDQPGVPIAAEDPYRDPVESPPQSIRVTMTTKPPADARVSRVFVVKILRQPTELGTYCIHLLESDRRVRLNFADVYPDLSTDATHKLASIVRGVVDDGVAELLRNAEAQLRQRGLMP